MLAMMLLHAVFGCCWHHSHETCAASAVESTAPAAEEQDRTGGDCCPCGHHHDEGQSPIGDEEPRGGHGGHDCCGEVCQFMTAAEVSPPSVGGLSLDRVIAEQSAAGLTARLQAVCLARSDGVSPSAPSATRLLTRLCVWRL